MFDQKAYNKEYQKKNRDTLRTKKREYYHKNKEAMKERDKARWPREKERRERYRKEWYKAHPEWAKAKTVEYNKKYKQKRLNWYYRKKYGISYQEVISLHQKQNGKCGICKIEIILGKRAQLDHDHDTKINRGLLCTRCNLGIGYMLDNPYLMMDAATYLLHHKSGRAAVV